MSNSILSELIDDRCWDGVVARLRSHPQEASDPVSRGSDASLPLHEACKLRPPPRVVLALLDAHGPAVGVRGRWSFLPLHIAAKSNSVHAVTGLLEAYPRAARLKDENGKLPVHLACEWGSSPDVIEKLLTIYPEGMFVRDNDGKSPVDHARSKSGRDAKVMQAMERGRVYCSVSKAAFFRVKEEFDDLMRGTVEAHNSNVLKLEKIHTEEIDVHRQLESGLQRNLKQTEERIAATKGSNDGLRGEMLSMRGKMKMLKESEAELQCRADSLESRLKDRTEDVDEKDAALADIRARACGMISDLEREGRKNAEQVDKISDLKRAVLSLSASVGALTATQTCAADEALETQARAVRMVVGEGVGDEVAEMAGGQRDLIERETEKLESMYMSA